MTLSPNILRTSSEHPPSILRASDFLRAESHLFRLFQFFAQVKFMQDLATLRCKQHRQAEAAQLLEENSSCRIMQNHYETQVILQYVTYEIYYRYI